MRVVLAPDAFKGCLSAAEACNAMREGVLRACPTAGVTAVPAADGGEGTTEALVAATGGHMLPVLATGPMGTGQSVTGQVGLLGDGTAAALEMACVSGLPLVPADRRNPCHTTTYGTGQLIAAALASGAEKLIVGIGGSATTDGGAGMAQALGAKFFGADDEEITQPLTGARLADVARIDLSGLDPRLAACRIEVACDVTNPLLGPDGAAGVYGPQKGASPADVARLEANLGHFIDIVEAHIGRTVRDVPGAGAAGGLGAGLMAFLNANLRPGVDIVLAAAGLADRLAGADLVLTGEGQIDAQTAHGKTISGVARLAWAAGVPVVALVGRIRQSLGSLAPLHLAGIHAIAPAEMPLDEAMRNARGLLAAAAERVATPRGQGAGRRGGGRT